MTTKDEKHKLRAITREVCVPHLQATEMFRRIKERVLIEDGEIIVAGFGTFYRAEIRERRRVLNGVEHITPAHSQIRLRGCKGDFVEPDEPAKSQECKPPLSLSALQVSFTGGNVDPISVDRRSWTSRSTYRVLSNPNVFTAFGTLDFNLSRLCDPDEEILPQNTPLINFDLPETINAGRRQNPDGTFSDFFGINPTINLIDFGRSRTLSGTQITFDLNPNQRNQNFQFNAEYDFTTPQGVQEKMVGRPYQVNWEIQNCPNE